MPTIDPERLMSDLRELRSIGAVETGVVRPALSPKDMEARRWLARKRSEEHTSELQSLMRISYAVFCLKNKIEITPFHTTPVLPFTATVTLTVCTFTT